SFEFNNPADTQPVAFIITCTGSKESDADVTFNNPTIRINQQDALVLPVNLKLNQVLYCDGQTVKLYNKQWQLLQTIALSRALPTVEKDKNEISFDGEYSGDSGPDVKIELRCKGIPELLRQDHKIK